MKTLDEVIDDFEKACDLERRCEDCSGCLYQENGCPNDGAESVPDALYYLREYKDSKRTVKVVHKQETHIVAPPKSTTVAYETETNLWTECGNCGAIGMYHGWNYCPNCGVKLDWSE